MNGTFKLNNGRGRSVLIDYKSDDGIVFKVDTIEAFGPRTWRTNAIMRKRELHTYLKLQIKTALHNQTVKPVKLSGREKRQVKQYIDTDLTMYHGGTHLLSEDRAAAKLRLNAIWGKPKR